MKPRPIIQILFAALFLSGAADFTLPAQEVMSPLPVNPNRPMPAGGGQGALLGGLGPVANVLTEEQRASFRRAMDAQREKSSDGELKLRDARRKLIESGLEGKFDEAAVRKLAVAVAGLEAEQAVKRAKALSQLQPPLSPEQVEKVKSSFAAQPRNLGQLQLPAGVQRRHNLTSTNRDENDLPVKQ